MNQRTRNFLRYLFVVLLGVFLHFAYELSGENPIVGLFALVNESIWEHLKLIFFPMLVLTLWDMFTTPLQEFWDSKPLGLIFSSICSGFSSHFGSRKNYSIDAILSVLNLQS